MFRFVFDKKLSPQEAAKLSNSVKNAKKLTHFLLLNTRATFPAFSVLLMGIANSSSLVHFDLNGCFIGNAGAERVGVVLRESKKLLTLNLNHNGIDNTGAAHIAEALSENNIICNIYMAKNKFSEGIVDIFLPYLKINKSLRLLDLGKDVKSMRINSAINENSISRQVMYEIYLSRPHSKRTRFLSTRINVFGGKNCGKTDLLNSLIHNINNYERKKLISKKRTTENRWEMDLFPKINVSYAKTFDGLNYWEEEEAVEAIFTETHALKSTALLLRKQQEKKKKKRSARKTQLKPGAGNKPIDSAIRRQQSAASSALSSNGISMDDGFSQEVEEIPTFAPQSKINALRTTKTLGRRTLTMKRSKSKRSFSSFGRSSKRSTLLSEDLGLPKKSSTFSLSSTLSKKSTLKSVSSFRKSIKVKPQRLNGGIDSAEEDEAELDDFLFDSSEAEEIDVESYIESTVTEVYITEADCENPRSSAVFKIYQKLHKEYDLDARNSNYPSSRAEKKKSTEAEDIDANLMMFSKAFKNQENQRNIKTINHEKEKKRQDSVFDRPGTRHSSVAESMLSLPQFNSKTKTTRKRRTKTLTTKANDKPEMHRPFSDQNLINIKNNINGLSLSFWEFTDNYYFDALYTKLHDILLCSGGFGINMFCFDIAKFVRNEELAKRDFAYHLSLANKRPETKLMLVAVKLDKITSQELQGVNVSIKRILKKNEIKGVLYNKSAKLVFFPVDNTKKMFGIKSLRRHLEVACKSLSEVKQHIRLQDMCLLDLILCKKLNKEGKAQLTLSLHEIRFFAKKLGISQDELSNLLELFHEVGYIIKIPKTKRIITNPQWFTESLGFVFDKELLEKTYEIVHPDPDKPRKTNLHISKPSRSTESYDNLDEILGEESDEIIEEDPDKSEKFLMTQQMLRSIVNDCTDVDLKFLTEVLRSNSIIVDWYFGDVMEQLTNGLINTETKKKNKIFLLPTLINDKGIIHQHRQLNKRGKALCKDFRIVFEVAKGLLFPSSFYSSFVCAAVKFLSTFRKRLQPLSKKKKGRKKSANKISVKLERQEESDIILLTANLGDSFCFVVKPEMTGISFSVPKRYRTGAYGSYVMFRALISKVNNEILDLKLKFDVRIGIKNKLVDIRKVSHSLGVSKKTKPPMDKIIDHVIGCITQKVAGVNGVEAYLRAMQ